MAEGQTVGRLQVLHDLVGVKHELPGKGHCGARHEGEHEHHGQVVPRPFVARVRVEHKTERGLQVCHGPLQWH